MIVVQAPVAQKVDNSFPVDKSLSGGIKFIACFISVVESGFSAIRQQPFSRRVFSG